jgi:hypothetical protein
MNYARLFLENASPPGTTSLIAAVSATTSVGDYTLNFSPEGATSDIKITASGKAGVQGTNSGVWLLPR